MKAKDYMFTTAQFTIDTFKFQPAPLHDVSGEFKEFCQTLLEGVTPESTVPFDEFEYLEQYELVSFFRDTGYWGAATQFFANEVAEVLDNDTRILDPFAGVGWMVKAFREAGLNVHGTDSYDWLTSQSVEPLDALDSVGKYGQTATHILLSWVPYGSAIDVDVVNAARELNPEIEFIYVGESRGGCTGSEHLWDLVKITRNFDTYASPMVFRNDFACLMK